MPWLASLVRVAAAPSASRGSARTARCAALGRGHPAMAWLARCAALDGAAWPWHGWLAPSTGSAAPCEASHAGATPRMPGQSCHGQPAIAWLASMAGHPCHGQPATAWLASMASPVLQDRRIAPARPPSPPLRGSGIRCGVGGWGGGLVPCCRPVTLNRASAAPRRPYAANMRTGGLMANKAVSGRHIDLRRRPAPHPSPASKPRRRPRH